MLAALLIILLFASSYARPPTEVEMPRINGLLTQSAVMTLDNDIIIPFGGDRTTGPVDPERNLRATYYYSCPTGGDKIREFEWHVVYRRSDRKVFMTAVTNIDHIDPIVMNRASFWTTWDGYLCTTLPGRMCSYVFFGRTEGTVSDTGLVLELVTEATDVASRPKVTEACFETTHLSPHTCPLNAPSTVRNCDITKIDVQVPPHVSV